jgi:hypothetical protein
VNSNVEPTTCPSTSAPTLELKFASPPYSAVTACAPGVRADVVSVATPAAFSVTGAPTLSPSALNCTVPVGTPAADVTAAVKVTLWPEAETTAEEVTPVFVAALSTLKDCATSAAAL